MLRAGVMRTYARFKDLTAQSRKKTPEAVEALAQGRIWMGTQAAQNGLWISSVISMMLSNLLVRLRD